MYKHNKTKNNTHKTRAKQQNKEEIDANQTKQVLFSERMLGRIERIERAREIERLVDQHTRNRRNPEASAPMKFLNSVRTQAKHVFARQENYRFESRGPIFLWLFEKSHNTRRKTKKNTNC